MGNSETEWGECGKQGWGCKYWNGNAENLGGNVKNTGNQGGDVGNQNGNLGIAVEMTYNSNGNVNSKSEDKLREDSRWHRCKLMFWSNSRTYYT